MARKLPETVRKGDIRRKSLTPMSDGRSRCEYPTTFLMEHPTGYWQSIAAPRLEEKPHPKHMGNLLGYAT